VSHGNADPGSFNRLWLLLEFSSKELLDCPERAGLEAVEGVPSIEPPGG